MNRLAFTFSQRVALFLSFFFLLAFGASLTHAQNALPLPNNATPSPPQPQPTPTATALPSTTPGVAATPSPASLPSIVPQAPTSVTPNIPAPVPGFRDPNAVIAPAPIVAPTPTPLPRPTQAPIPTPVPAPGDVTGEASTSDNFGLDSPNGIIYDMERGLVLAEGNVTLRYGNFVVKGQRGVLDTNTNDATLTGNLTVTAELDGRSQTFTGKTLVFNTVTRKWILSQLETTFPPELFPPGTVLAPLYQTDGTVTGQDETARGENFRFSSCDRDHYYIRSNRIEFSRLPNGTPSRITLRKNAIFLLGQKILPLPAYTISLYGQRSRRQPLQTSFGQNQVDGFFAKTIFDLRATAKYTDSVLLDALSKRGLGLGLQRELIGGGFLYLYAVSGKTGGREINARVNKTYQISKLISSALRFDKTQNNSLTGSGIASSSGNFSLTRAGSRAQTNTLYNFSESNFSTTDGTTTTTSNSRNDSLSIQHSQNFGNRVNFLATGNLNQSSFGNTGANDTLNQTGDLNLQLNRTGNALDIALITELHNNFRDGNAAYQLERLPELFVRSDTQRLQLGGVFNKLLPGSLAFGMGTYNEPVTSISSSSSTTLGGQKSRADFLYNLNQRSIKLLGRDPDIARYDETNGGSHYSSGSVFKMSGQFEQAFYSDNTARYNYAVNLNNTSRVGPIQFLLNYSKQRTFGFTPFQFDFYNPGEYMDYVASIGRTQNFNLSISGGRDIQNSFNRDIIANMQWLPTPGTYISLGTSYGLQAERKGLFGDIYGNIKFTRRSTRTLGGQFSLGFRYTPSGTGTNQGLTRVNAAFDTNVTRKIRFQTLVGYDGVSNRFDFQQYRAIVDLHCFNLYTTYDSSTKQLRFDLALKAFPFADTRFGRNNFSEGFDPGVGTVQ